MLPALLVFSFGLSLTVAPLTATVLADASEMDAGIASAVNNAIARTGSLVAVAAVGAVVASFYGAQLDHRLGHRLPASSQAALREAARRTFGSIDAGAVPSPQRAFVRHETGAAGEEAFHVAMGVATVLLTLAGLSGLAIRGKPRTVVAAGDCAGGQLAGQPLSVAADLPTAEPAVMPAGLGSSGCVSMNHWTNGHTGRTARPRARASSRAPRTSCRPEPATLPEGSTSACRNVMTPGDWR